MARGILPLATALALAEVVDGFLGPGSVSIKWPNDVLINGKKCAGILMEATQEAVLIGIGLNINESDFPEEIADIASSMMMESGQRFSRESVFSRLCKAMDHWMQKPLENVLDAYREAVAGLGEHVTLVYGETEVSGRMIDIHTDGGLVLQSDEERNVYYAGDVTIKKENL